MKKSIRTRLLALAAMAAVQAHAAPTLVESVQGYTLQNDKIASFSGLVFDQGKVLATGDAAALRAKYPDARRIDGQGKTLLPGLIDAHGHVFRLGFKTTEISLSGTRDLQEAQGISRAYGQKNPQRQWLLGYGWNQVNWKLGRFPTAADDVQAGWDWLTKICGVPANQIVVAGDSAGGHLIVDMLLQADVAAVPPAGAVLLSPLYDVTFGLSLERERISPDPAASAANAIRLVSLYHTGVDPAHPRLRLDVASGPPLPTTLIQAGGAEMLQEDARHLAADIAAGGGQCELQVWPHQMHVFQALPRMTPDSARAMAHVARFISAVLTRNVTAKAG